MNACIRFCFLLWLVSGFERAVAGNTSVAAWGYNGDGEANVPPGLTNAVAISSGGWHALALKNDGTVVDWGLVASVPPGLGNVIAIGAGSDPNSLALTSSGTLVAWGGNDYGVSTPPAGLDDVVAISAGYVHSLAVRTNGTVVAWGDNSSG